MQGFNIEILYIKRSHRATIHVLGGKRIRVSVPVGFSEDEVAKILLKKSKWILKTQNRLEVAAAIPEIKWCTGQLLPFFGEKLCLKIIPGFGQVTANGDYLYVMIPPGEDESETYVKLAVAKWYKEQALLKLRPRVQHFAEKLGVRFKSFTLKSYKSRWGSCSSRGELVFNWQILSFPPDLVDYVVAHEICHLKEMNHSRSFYRHLASLGFERRFFHPRIRPLKNIF